MTAILITQCLQNDFVKLLGKFDPIPNELHVGYEESIRLLGEKIEEGPVNTLMEWAYENSSESLELIHIRDWHNPMEPSQKDHLAQFGYHCIQNTEGANFVFQNKIKKGRSHHIVNASGLNDFIDTDLEKILSPYKEKKCRVGVAGVWTEAKITYLLYDLKTRYPNFELATCSLVTASSSRSAHFYALDSLHKLLGTTVFTSLSDFTFYLNNTAPSIDRRIKSNSFTNLIFEDNYIISQTDEKIIRYLFRDTKEVKLICLDGGFSGNVVLKAKAIDRMNHTQVPCVIKIGNRDPISKERISFEKIQEVLGNNSPNIVDFVELEDRGGIKYRYASMLDGKVTTFQKLYCSTFDIQKIKYFLDIVFKEQLGRLYEASGREKLNLLKYYDFQPKYSSAVRQRVSQILNYSPVSETLSIEGIEVYNVCNFYEKELDNLHENQNFLRYQSFIHGDLNGANIIIDAQENVWIIDFFHTHRGHILKDLIKLENDILYIFTKYNNRDSLKEGFTLINSLLEVQDLAIPPDPSVRAKFTDPEILRAFDTISHLRGYYSNLIHTDRDPYQYRVSALRYAMHTLSFDESDNQQKKLALYAGCLFSSSILKSLKSPPHLRIDFIESPDKKRNIGLTILPGRKDRKRDLNEDIKTIQSEGISAVLCLISRDEMHEYGLENLLEEYQRSGLEVYHLPILDQGVCSVEDANTTLKWMRSFLQREEKVLIHCVGGLGRSGTMASIYFKKYFGMDAKSAVELVRNHRSKRAVESKIQLEFIEKFNPD